MMTPVQWIVFGYIGLFCIVWIIGYLRAAWTILHTDRLWKVDPPEPKAWPKLSVIAAACNEGETIRDALTSLLTTDYPHVEFIIVNDRSTDDTGAILAEIAATDERIVPLEVTERPDGWLGKTHALHIASQKASGDWLLFTDADVHFTPSALGESMAFALAEDTDHLTMCPNMKAGTFVLRVVIHAFAVAFMQNLRIEKLKDPDTTAFAGSGSFNMVRRDAFNNTPGFEWLRMDVVDDVGLGLMLRNAGASTRFAMSGPAVQVEWYPSLGAMFNGLTKNAFGAAGHYSILRMSAIVLLGFLFAPAPFVALATALGSGFPCGWATMMTISLGVAAIVAFVIAITTLRVTNPWIDFGAAILSPIGVIILTMIAFYSMVVCVRSGGVDWRGTHYPLDELKKNQRLKL
jgi:hypothetical protein